MMATKLALVDYQVDAIKSQGGSLDSSQKPD